MYINNNNNCIPPYTHRPQGVSQHKITIQKHVYYYTNRFYLVLLVTYLFYSFCLTLTLNQGIPNYQVHTCSSFQVRLRLVFSTVLVPTGVGWGWKSSKRKIKAVRLCVSASHSYGVLLPAQFQQTMIKET